MKKQNLATLAMIGISAGIVAGGCQQKAKANGASTTPNSQAKPSDSTKQMKMPSQADMDAFNKSLSPDAQKKFKDLDIQHKAMAMAMMDQSCNGKNECAGIGGCATPEHSCAGANSCKGKGGAPVEDPNKAVEVQYKNQMNERQKANGEMKKPSDTNGQTKTNGQNS